MATSLQGGIKKSTNDPIAKAVADHVEKLTTPTRTQVRCEDCDLIFTSEVVRDAHLQGARHAKQIRSKSILANLEETNVAFSKDQETNGLKCNPCNVYLNSIQQLQTHINGNRHKKQLEKGDWTGKEIVTRMDTTGDTNGSDNIPLSGGFTPQPVSTPPAPKIVTLLTCYICNKFVNSESQMRAHEASQKHIDKANNVKGGEKKRFAPYWKKGSNGPIQTRGAKTNYGNIKTQHLNNSFISGGYQNY